MEFLVILIPIGGRKVGQGSGTRKQQFINILLAIMFLAQNISFIWILIIDTNVSSAIIRIKYSETFVNHGIAFEFNCYYTPHYVFGRVGEGLI